jgi:hypothetical protein
MSIPAMSIHGNSIAVAVVLSTMLASPAQSDGAAVPWLDQPVAAPPAALTAPPPLAPRRCSADDLHIALGATGARHGYATQEILITNHSSDACSMTGFPVTQILPESETPQTLGAHEQAPQLASEQVNLSPGEQAIMLVGAPGSCEAATGETRKVARKIQFSLPGASPKVLEGAQIDTLCGPASVLHFSAVRNVAAPGLLGAAASGPQTGELTGAVNAPIIARRGETLRYTVTLSNPTGSEASLAPCPSYTQSLYSEGKVASNTMRLNCSAAGNKIAAQASATFEIQLPIPASLPPGDAKLSWVLQNGPGVGAVLALQ